MYFQIYILIAICSLVQLIEHFSLIYSIVYILQVCRDNGVDCIVAPYEADAQLAFLNLKGIADIIITEDSDLLLFGCEKVVQFFNL